MSSYGNIDETDLFIPDLSDLVLDGVTLQYGEPFECPFCRTIQNAENRIEWKKHLFSDLKPYVCTFEHCLSQPFESRHEWFQHELDNHRRQLLCTFCNSPTAAYSSEADMADHLRRSHIGDVTDAQLHWLLRACDRPVLHSGAFNCPFCDQWDPNKEDIKTTEFGQHVARHLRALSLVSLPLAIDGLETVNDNSESEQPVDTASTEYKDISNTATTDHLRLLRISPKNKRFGRSTKGLKYGWLNPFRQIEYNTPVRANTPLSRDELNLEPALRRVNEISDPSLRHMGSGENELNESSEINEANETIEERVKNQKSGLI